MLHIEFYYEVKVGMGKAPNGATWSRLWSRTSAPFLSRTEQLERDESAPKESAPSRFGGAGLFILF